MKKPRFSAFLAFSCLALLLGPAGAQEGTALRTLDLSSLVREAGAEQAVSFEPVLGGLQEDEELLPSDPRILPPIDPDRLASLLGGALGDKGTLWARGDGVFFLMGPPKALDRACSLGNLLSRTLGAVVPVEGVWFEPGGTDLPWPGPLLGAEEADRLWKGLGEGRFGRILARFSFQVPVGGACLRARLESAAQVRTYQSEVASKSKITYPSPCYPKTGFLLRLRAALLPGGKAALFLDARRGWDLELRKVEIGLDRSPWVEAGKARFFLGAASGLVPAGGALLFRSARGKDASLLALRVLDLPHPEDKVVFLGPAFLGWHRGLGLPMPPLPGGDQPGGWSSGTKEEGGPPQDQDKFKLFLMGAGLDVKALFPSGALLAGPTWVPAAWRTVSAGLDVPVGWTCGVRILLKGMSLSTASGLTPQEVFQRGAVLRDVSFPVLAGREGVFVAGEESQHVSGYSSNVAQKSALLVPESATLFSGLTGKVSIHGNRARVEIFHSWASPPEMVETGARENGPLERVDFRWGRLSGDYPVDGRFRLLGEGVKVGKGDKALRVVAGLVLQRL